MSSNSSTPFGFAFGARYMLDRVQQFNSEGTPVYIRMQAVDETISDFADIGFSVAVSGGQFQDYQIIPQPTIFISPTSRVGLPETQLQLDKNTFIISHNWVLSQMKLFSFTKPLQVFRDPRVIGIVWDGDVQSIESINQDHAGGQTIDWIISTANANLSK